MSREIYIVVVTGPMVLAAYTSSNSAFTHARCVTGAFAVAIELRDDVPPEIRRDIEVAEQGSPSWEDWDDDTPVEEEPTSEHPRYSGNGKP